MSASVRVSSDAPVPLDDMIAAVGIEISAVQRRSRASIITVTDGVRDSQVGAGAVYRFTCSASPLRDDDRIVGDFDGARVEGVVVSRERGVLTLALEADLGPRVAHGRLMIDQTYLWTTLRDRLHQLRSAACALNRRNVDLLTGRAAPTVAARAPADPAALEDLNSEQAACLHQALGSDICLGWGPPGTGKTVVCERIVADGFYGFGQSTLLVAPTNKAVDLVLGRVLRRLERHGKLAEALASRRVVRVGPFSDPVLQREYGALVTLDAIVARETHALLEERGRLVAAQEEVTGVRDADAAPVCVVAKAGRLHQGVAAAELRLSVLGAEIRRIDARVKQVRQNVLQQARIVATTVHRAYMPDQVERMFDAVVLDEGGMTNLPAACCAAARARSHVVIMGDFRQLGAIVTADDRRVADWVARDAYHATGVVRAVEEGRAARGLVALRVQHRCDPAIARLTNAVTYRHAPLTTHASVLARPPLPSPWGSAPLMLVDTSPLRPFAHRAGEGESRCNPVHAGIVRWLIEELVGAGCVPEDPASPDGVIVLSPFREQLKLLRKHIPRDIFARAFDASTVHRYQGDERGTVILDLVDSRGLPRLSRLLQGTDLSATGPRLVNVAATRARRRLIVVADTRYLLRGTRRGPVSDFVRHLVREAARIPLPQERVRNALTYVERWESRR